MSMGPSDAVLAAANERADKMPTDALVEALNAVGRLSAPEREEVVAAIAAALPTVDNPAGAGFLAVWLGASVERGRDPERTATAVLETLMRWAQSLPEMPDNETPPEPAPDVTSGLEMLGRSMVSHLSRSERLLAAIRSRDDVRAVLAEAEAWSVGAMWVMEILRQRSGEIVVLHGRESKGFRVAYENLSNCFHLFTLLQGAMEGRMPGSRLASSQTLAVARGERVGNVSDEAWWHYGQASSPEPEIAGMVFGEASPDAIKDCGGEQVLLLWPPILEGRGWDAGFFSPSLQVAPPSVTVQRELSADEVAEWRDRLGLPEAVAEPPKRPWWKLF